MVRFEHWILNQRLNKKATQQEAIIVIYATRKFRVKKEWALKAYFMGTGVLHQIPVLHIQFFPTSYLFMKVADVSEVSILPFSRLLKISKINCQTSQRTYKKIIICSRVAHHFL